MTVQSALDAGALTVTVQDAGRGSPAQWQRRCGRSRATKTRPRRGTQGWGLRWCNRLIMCRGTLGATLPPAGCSVRLRLPAIAAACASVEVGGVSHALTAVPFTSRQPA